MTNKAIITALGAVVSLGLSQQALSDTNTKVQTQTMQNLTQQMPQGFEKCYGIAKAGKNDCGSGTEACAGQSTTDNAKNAWIGLPKGTCDKIVGGSTTENKS